MIKQKPVSDQHLLCLMELWFDGSVPLIKALAAFPDDDADVPEDYCPFCDIHAQIPSHDIYARQKVFVHEPSCPVVKARNLLNNMIREED